MLKWVKRLCLFLLMVLMFLLAIVFGLENGEIVTPVFFGVPSAPLSVGLWMTIALFLGALVGLLLSLLPVYLGRYACSRKEKELQRFKKELSDLKSAKLVSE